MRIWLALIVAPILALADLSVSFATVTWACAHQHSLAVHVVHLLFLGVSLACTLVAWSAWRDPARPVAADAATAQTHFLAGVATATGTLSTAAIAAMWIPAWIIAPCLG
jgi:hypothetical protein